MRYNVRCCCQPRKILGWMDLPNDRTEMTIVTEMVPVTMANVTMADTPVRPRQHLIQIKKYYEGFGGYEWAIYSEDRPIEFWRQVRGFHEQR